MSEIKVTDTQTIDRFLLLTAPTQLELLEEMNSRQEGTSSVIGMGQAQDGSWYVYLDRALKVILTIEDVAHIKGVDTSDEVLRNKKINMSA